MQNTKMPIFTHSTLGMQFIHPEILWTLFLLVSSVALHLFQCCRFKSIPFINITILKQVVSESRKSNRLKHSLYLLVRICYFSTAPYTRSIQNYTP